MSDTPRTDRLLTAILDAHGFVHKHNCPPQWVMFARELERELNAANTKIKRLEQAGDEIEMILLQYARRIELPKTAAAEQSELSCRLCIKWRETKEAKL